MATSGLKPLLTFKFLDKMYQGKSLQILFLSNFIHITGPYGRHTIPLKVLSRAIVCQEPQTGGSANRSETNIKTVIKLPGQNLRTFLKQIRDAIQSVTVGWFVELEVVGLGFTVDGIITNTGETNLVLNLGFTHEILYTLPSGVFSKIDTKKKKGILLYGNDKQKVMQVAHDLCHLRKRNPYKFRGIKLKNEVIKLKPGKSKQG